MSVLNLITPLRFKLRIKRSFLPHGQASLTMKSAARYYMMLWLVILHGGLSSAAYRSVLSSFKFCAAAERVCKARMVLEKNVIPLCRSNGLLFALPIIRRGLLF